MVIAKSYASKRADGQDIERIAEKLRSFDINAPIGTWKIDTATDRLLQTRSLPGVVPYRLVRWHMKNCCATGLRTARSLAEARLIDASAKNFQEMLAALRALAFNISKLETDVLVDYVVLPYSENPLSHEAQAEEIEDDLRKAKALSGALVAYIDRFNDRTQYVGPYTPPNRVVPFTFGFIQALADCWRRMFSQAPIRSDLADMTFLTAMALSDFGYLLSSSQQKSDIWLSDRIRKQIFGK